MVVQQHLGGKIIKQLTLNDFQLKLNAKFPGESLQALTYVDMNSPARVKCKTCGREVELKSAQSFFVKSKKRVCPTCFPNKRDKIAASKEKFINYLRTQDLFIIDDEQRILDSVKNSDSLVELKCTKCGKINKKTMYDYMRGRGCTCSCTNTFKTTEEFKAQLPEDIELLEEYQGAFVNVLFKHKSCGFCWKAKPHNILSGKGCPKCNRKVSKGEQAIERVLKELNVDYIKEYEVIIDGHHLRIDFYIPSMQLGIEYNGIQHYEPVEHFGGEERFETQQYYDKLKQNNYNILTIPFWEFDCIKEKITQVFNDYLKREQSQATRKDNHPNSQDDDIV